MKTTDKEGAGGGTPGLVADGACRWRIDRHGEMRVPAVVFASDRRRAGAQPSRRRPTGPRATLRREPEAAGIAVSGSTARGLAEEAPLSYKDINEVVATRVGTTCSTSSR